MAELAERATLAAAASYAADMTTATIVAPTIATFITPIVPSTVILLLSLHWLQGLNWLHRL